MEHALCIDGGTAWMPTEDRTREALHRLERQAAVGQLTGGAAHEFNNLMTIVLGNVEFLERELRTSDPKVARYLSFLRIAAQRGTKLSSQLLAFSGRRAAPPEPINLNETVQELAELMRTALSQEIRLDLQPSLWLVRDDPALVERQIFALAARDARSETLCFETTNVRKGPPQRDGDLAAGPYVMIAVHDGETVTPDMLREADDFARTRGGGAQADGTSVRLYLPALADI